MRIALICGPECGAAALAASLKRDGAEVIEYDSVEEARVVGPADVDLVVVDQTLDPNGSAVLTLERRGIACVVAAVAAEPPWVLAKPLSYEAVMAAASYSAVRASRRPSLVDGQPLPSPPVMPRHDSSPPLADTNAGVAIAHITSRTRLRALCSGLSFAAWAIGTLTGHEAPWFLFVAITALGLGAPAAELYKLRGKVAGGVAAASGVALIAGALGAAGIFDSVSGLVASAVPAVMEATRRRGA